MQVISASYKDKKKWDNYIANHKEGTFYHLFGWKGVIERTYNHDTKYLMTVDRGEITGVLPLILIKSKVFGNTAVSIPFCTYSGICADNPEALYLLLEKAKGIMKTEGIHLLELRHNIDKGIKWRTKKNNVTMLLELKAQEELWSSFRSKVRNQIRKAQQSNLKAIFGREYIDDFYSIYSHNMRDLGTPCHSKRLFENLLEEYSKETDILTIWKEDTAIASIFLVKYKDTISDPWASSLRRYLRYCPNNLLYWEALKYGCEQGYKYFDFGRSQWNSGTFRFKKQWGARPVQLYYQYHSINKKDDKEIDYTDWKYRLFTTVWKKLPLPVSRVIGPSIRKYIA